MALLQTALTDGGVVTKTDADDDLPPAPATVEDPTDDQQRMLADRAREYARQELADSRFFDAFDVDDIRWTVSTNSQRTRTAATAEVEFEDGEVTDRAVSLTWRAYAAWGWGEKFEGAVLHELAHHVDYTRRGISKHDVRFELYADALGADIRAPEFYDDHRLRVFCGKGCEDGREKASALVKGPGDRKCRKHGATFTVEHVESGRTWEANGGYEEARAAIEAAADVEW
ncbi:hypothetical protein [Halobacterium rubrum]|uniref:hypothetical protein n=1 Tax=Halobacterium TaxID=2239 RepID=UPI001F277A76|nr:MULTISPECIES: hypothetical protein [Halobacterium]MDH5021720.1 hypothetical protein [Halobacterium rubrum]